MYCLEPSHLRCCAARLNDQIFILLNPWQNANHLSSVRLLPAIKSLNLYNLETLLSRCLLSNNPSGEHDCLFSNKTGSMSTLKEKFKAKADEQAARVKKLMQEYGHTKI